MLNNPLISIIIPVYNVGAYIERCLRSCINQTLYDIEIIIVDDCGSDDSIHIATQYALLDKRIRIVHNPCNLGLFAARITGERIAKGRYILPVDGDDYISLHTCKILYKTLYTITNAPIKALRLIKNVTGGGHKMNTPIISLIIPVYNVRPYISRCLESCINQSLKEIEIIIVDDCGSDGAMEIIKAYATLDSRIKIIHNPQNLGTFAARIKGAKEARGLYLSFIDADDYIDLYTCEKAYQRILQEAQCTSYSPQNIQSYAPYPLQDSLPDIVFFGMRFEPRTFRRVSPPVITKTLYEEEVLSEVFAHCATPPWHICAKLYKASHIVHVIDFIVAHMGENPRLTMAEDVLKSFWLCALAQKSIGIKDKLYIYCDSAASITRKTDIATRDKKIADISCVINELKKLNQIPILKANPAFIPAQTHAINILKSVRELEYRYDGLLANGGGV